MPASNLWVARSTCSSGSETGEGDPVCTKLSPWLGVMAFGPTKLDGGAPLLSRFSYERTTNWLVAYHDNSSDDVSAAPA